jgi:hypothetical protein
MPGSAAETRADACRSSGAATSRSRCRCRCATGLWAVQPSRSRSGCLASAPACRRRRRCWSPGPAPDLEGRRWAARPWWSEPVGPAASLWRTFAVCSFATFTAWRPRLETASQPASRLRPTSGRHHGLRAGLRRCLGLCRDITSASRPPPADWVALLFPCSRGMKRTAGPMAWRQPGKLRPPPTRRPHRRRPRPGYWPVLPRSPRWLAPSSEPMTTPRPVS